MKNVKFSKSDIEKFETRYRACFINSLSGFKSANLLGSVSIEGVSNLSIVSSCFHLGANPALIGLIIRPHHEENHPRHSLQNILQLKYFTLNHVHEDIQKQSHQCSARYSSEESEFEKCELSEEYVDEIKVPFVKEAKIKLGLKLVEHQLLLNECNLIIGEIDRVIVPEDFLEIDGNLRIDLAKSLCVSGLDTYHKGSFISRLSYAKVGQWPKEL